MAKLFDEAEACRQLEAAEAEIRRACRHAQRQQPVLAGRVAAAALALGCVFMLMRRRRVGQAAGSGSGVGRQ